MCSESVVVLKASLVSEKGGLRGRKGRALIYEVH